MSWVRSTAEKLSRGRILRRRFSPAFGRQIVYVTPDSALRYWRRNVEAVDPDLIMASRALVEPNDSVWDIGANCGLFSFASAYLAGPGGQILAVEPDTSLAVNLQRSKDARKPDIADVTVLPCAVSNELGVADLHIAARGRSSNAMGPGRSQTGGIRTSQTTVVVTLDWLAERYRPPDVIKIDVEGLELQVLQGGKGVLLEHRPTLYVEVGSEDGERISSYLSEFGYGFYAPGNLDVQVNDLPFNTVAMHPSRQK